MEPNKFDSFPNTELGNIQPLGPQPVEQPVQPMEPVQQPAMEQPQQPIRPVNPLQPTGPQPMSQPVQPMGQPMQPMEPAQPQKPKTNLLMIGIIAGAAVLLTVVAIVVVLSMNGGNKSKPAAVPTPEPVVENTTPTPELAKAVCEEHNGTFEAFEEDYFTSSNTEIQAMYNCKHYKNAQKTEEGELVYVSTYVSGDFEYTINFIDEEKLSQYREKVDESSKNITDNNIKTLKDTGGLIGFYGSTLVNEQDGKGVRAYGYSLLYENASLQLTVYDKDDTLALEILEGLGFPNPNNIISDETGSNDPSAEQRDKERRDDYTMLIAAINNYIANHNGEINNMVKDADPHKLTASKWINETGNDPNGKPYDLKAYSWATWNNAPVVPYGSDGSQVFVIINANCNGTDANGNSTPAKDKAVRSFAVYGYLESGRFCQASGSAG